MKQKILTYGNFNNIYEKREKIVLILSAISGFLFFLFIALFETPRNPPVSYILAFSITIPLKFALGFIYTPKEDGWRKEATRITFFSFGMSFAIGVIGLLVIAFFAAATGQNWGLFGRVGSSLFVALGEYVALGYIIGEIRNFLVFGIKYLDNMEIKTNRNMDFTESSFFNENKELVHHLSILNLSENHSEEDLQKRYRELASLYHPDRMNNMSERQKQIAEAEFKRIKTSYDYLKKN